MKKRGPRTAGRYVGALHRFARRYFAAQMSRLGLPPTAFPLILRLLRRDNVSQDELAGDFLVDKGTAARTLAKLEEAGLVTRTVDEEDRRIKRVRVTEKARELEPEIMAAARAWNEKLLDGFSAEEKEAALAYLQRMTRNARAHWEDVAEAEGLPARRRSRRCCE
ncbi:MAG: MarR family winged helix-turn-helix transcriptional regulator [Armatimonadota bacterium]